MGADHKQPVISALFKEHRKKVIEDTIRRFETEQAAGEARDAAE